MQLKWRRFDLELAHRWIVASSQAQGGRSTVGVVFVSLRDPKSGVEGIGEASPPRRFGETQESIERFLGRVDSSKLSFEDPPTSMKYLDGILPRSNAARAALNIALLDGRTKKNHVPLYRELKLHFHEGEYVTSFSIGIDDPATVKTKVGEASAYPILKLKVGSPDDDKNLAALREAAPDKKLRLDANEGWKTKEEALAAIERLAKAARIEFIEQPLPAGTHATEMKWLKERSPVPLVADESFTCALDAERCAECFHGVNVKLVKVGGIDRALESVFAAKHHGLFAMLGCMIESSLLISAAAHLAPVAQHFDLDGNLLIGNDPYHGVESDGGVLSFSRSPHATGLCVAARKR
jgi:L-alanine-DL-glutamate epimerase-like enolase superfamily enzyme